MELEDMPGYLRRILTHVEKISETVQSMTVDLSQKIDKDEDIVNISQEAVDKLKKGNN